MLWITAGLSCDGDTISITAATQPSIEDIAARRDPRPSEGAPAPSGARVRERGTISSRRFDAATRGELRGRSCSSSKARSRTKRSKTKATGPRSAPIPPTGQPITTCDWIDELAPHALGRRRHRHVRDVRRHPRDERQSDGRDGPRRLPRLGLEVAAPAFPIVCVPGCPVQPDNFMETLLYLLYQAAGLAPMIPLDEALRPTWLFSADGARGLRSRRLLRAGRFRRGIRLAESAS